MKKTHLIVAIILATSVIISSCNDIEEAPLEKFDNASISSTTTGSNEGLMEFAPAGENPYTVANMQLALDALAAESENTCDLTLFNIRTTHKYIKFKPQDSTQYGLLIQDTTLELYDYPLDRTLTKAGTYYQDPSIPDNQPSFQWTAVEADKQLPTGIPYDIVADLYIPEQDPDLVQYYETPFDDCITALGDMSMILTGTYDSTDSYVETDGGVRYKWGRPSKWNPKGRIQLFDDVLSSTNGLEGVKVRARRWFTMYSMLTDENGNFGTSHQFRR
jgi:hypothetical protein